MGAGVEDKRLESEKWDSQRTTLKSNAVQCLCRFQSFEVCIAVPYIFKKDFVFIYAYMSVSMYAVCAHECRLLQRPKEGTRSGAWVTGSSDQRDIDAWNQTWVLYRSNKCSLSLSHLPSPVHSLHLKTCLFLLSSQLLFLPAPTADSLPPSASLQMVAWCLLLSKLKLICFLTFMMPLELIKTADSCLVLYICKVLSQTFNSSFESCSNLVK